MGLTLLMQAADNAKFGSGVKRSFGGGGSAVSVSSLLTVRLSGVYRQPEGRWSTVTLQLFMVKSVRNRLRGSFLGISHAPIIEVDEALLRSTGSRYCLFLSLQHILMNDIMMIHMSCGSCAEITADRLY